MRSPALLLSVSVHICFGASAVSLKAHGLHDRLVLAVLVLTSRVDQTWHRQRQQRLYTFYKSGQPKGEGPIGYRL